MSLEHLPLSEAHSVDLVALRAWHWKASKDGNRDQEMRDWHRDQVRFIEMRISAHKTEKITPELIALVELATEASRADLHTEIELVCAGDWEKNCQLAREAIRAKLAKHPKFQHLW